jgi:hypothetical protein
MKVSSILVGALAAVVSATPIPGKEISKRGAFGSANVFGSLFGDQLDLAGVNGFGFNNALLAHLALVNGVDQNILQGFAVNNNVAFDGLAQTLLFQGAGFGQLGLAQILDLHSLISLSWLSNNGLINSGFDVGGIAFPNAVNFGLIDQFGLQDFAFELQIDQLIQDNILASLANSALFVGGAGFGAGFGGAAGQFSGGF